MNWWRNQPYVTAAAKRQKALRAAKGLAKRGEKLSPVTLAGRRIASSFWGKAWCDNLESYRDFEYRLPRGRTYVRNGSVLDLRIEAGQVTARVSGSSLYTVQVKIKSLAQAHWARVRSQCAGQVGSLIELLQGKLSERVMGIVTHRAEGLFPKPAEIAMSCSCPDIATMCKHVAAALYGVGARLDAQPELLFTLRKVNHEELIAQAADMEIARAKPAGKTIADEALADVFGIEIESVGGASTAGQKLRKSPASPRRKTRVAARRKAGKSKRSRL
jgi:uncharacterized Zn finger protein